MIESDNNGVMSYTLNDHQGSMCAAVTGRVTERLNYDAWGRRRDPVTLSYDNVTSHFDRGYTMHEHYDDFGLINMNGRMYDPLVGRMLSPDIVIQDEHNPQSYNRYTYCLNNPLRFTDPSGYVVRGSHSLFNYYSLSFHRNRNSRQAFFNTDEVLRNNAPIYNEDGVFLGTDDQGLQGDAIIMNEDYFTQGMSHNSAMELGRTLDNMSDEQALTFANNGNFESFINHYNSLSSRPDWDGYLTLEEANDWYRNGSGQSLYADLSKIDLSGILSLGERFVGGIKTFNLLFNSISINDGLVYGNLTLKRYSNHTVKAFTDKYDFDMKPWKNPLNWGRNVETMIGHKVAGEGISFEIWIYGQKTLTPLLPWIK